MRYCYYANDTEFECSKSRDKKVKRLFLRRGTKFVVNRNALSHKRVTAGFKQIIEKLKHSDQFQKAEGWTFWLLVELYAIEGFFES